MNRSSLKSSIFLITYGIVLYLVLSHIGLVAGAGSYIMTVLRPVIIGVVMAYVINLLMRPMETKWLAGLWRRCPRLARGKRGLCIVLSILGVLAIITALCLFILPQVGESLLSLANSIPGYLADAGDFFNGLESRLDMENEVISYLWKQGEELINQSGTLIKNFVGSAATWLLSFVTGLASGIINGFLGIIFAIYILADKEHLNYIYHRLLRAIFKDSIRERIEYIVRKIDRAFGGFISGQLIEACILGSVLRRAYHRGAFCGRDALCAAHQRAGGRHQYHSHPGRLPQCHSFGAAHSAHRPSEGADFRHLPRCFAAV